MYTKYCIFTLQYSLQDAALLAANDHPVPLGFAAEAGVNTYAQISLPSLLHKVHLFPCLPELLVASGEPHGKIGRGYLHSQSEWDSHSHVCQQCIVRGWG